MTETITRVVLVDDHPIVTDGLCLLLSSFDDIDVVGVADSGQAAVRLCREVAPDVVVMDLSMPGLDGIRATSRLLEERPGTRVVALTAFSEEELVRGVLEAGAVGYLLKTASGEELVDAIRAAARGRASISLEILPILPSTALERRPGHDLTSREREVLDGLAKGWSNKRIAAELDLSPGTIRVHVSNVLAKLGVANRTEAAARALNEGIVGH